MAKKKKEEIVLNKTELVPTTIGVLDKRENGPIVAIVLIILFVVCIFLLPYFNEWLNGVDTVVETPTDTPSPSIDDEPNEDPAPETQYYPISSDLSIDIDGYSFSSFVIQNNNQTLSYTITNTSGEANYFETHNYFMELYSGENELLQRIKLSRDDIVGSSTFTVDISSAIANGTVTQVAIKEILVEDYPSVSLSTNTAGVSYLTCTKDSQTLTYYFTEQNDTYALNEIRERTTFLNTAADYNATLESYTTLVASLNSVTGITSSLLPTTTGFTYELTLQLGSVTSTTMNRYFTDSVYYAANTEAKEIAFELESDNYTCQ